MATARIEEVVKIELSKSEALDLRSALADHVVSDPTDPLLDALAELDLN